MDIFWNHTILLATSCYTGLEINKILMLPCKFLVANSNRIDTIHRHHILEILNDQGFEMHYRVISNRGSVCEVSERGRERVVYFSVSKNNQTW